MPARVMPSAVPNHLGAVRKQCVGYLVEDRISQAATWPVRVKLNPVSPCPNRYRSRLEYLRCRSGLARQELGERKGIEGRAIPALLEGVENEVRSLYGDGLDGT